MPNYIRWKWECATYFLTVVTHGRQRFFAASENQNLLGECFREARKTYPFELDACVLLPDHFHALLTPAEGADYSTIIRLIKTRFTQHFLTSRPVETGEFEGTRPGEKRVWQRRFFEHTIRDEIDWERHVNYIHLNPVRHGLVANPEDWSASSIHRFMRQESLKPGWEMLAPPDLVAAWE